MTLPAPVLAPQDSSPPAVRLGSHQIATIDAITQRPFCGVWLPMGGGKTVSTLLALQRLRPAGHTLVIAPLTIARSIWLDEIEKWSMPVRTKSLIVDENDRRLTARKRLKLFQQVFTDPPTMYFINQELLTRPPRRDCTVCHGEPPRHIPVCTACQTGLVDQMPLHRDETGKLVRIWPFQTVIVDEAQAFKSHSSQRFKALASVRPAITRMIQLSGTPAPNGLHDLWSQVYLLDQGEALGRTITEFRKRWFIPKLIPGQTIPGSWEPMPHAEKEIHQAISHLVMSAENTDLQLPEIQVIDRTVRLPVPIMRAYQNFKEDLALTLINEKMNEEDIRQVIAANKAVLQAKLMQFASGTLYTSDPDDPSTHGEYRVIHDQKIQMAEYLIRNTSSPVLLAYHFISDRIELMKHFHKTNVAVEVFDGSRQMLQRWNARKIPVMLIHPASAGHGLNLQHGGSTLIWYTLPFSLEHYLQTNKRLHRPGQKDPVTIYRLISHGTHDEHMPRILTDKQATQDALIEAVSHEKALFEELEMPRKLRESAKPTRWT